MDLSGWTDRNAIEAWLLQQAMLPDEALDLAQMALALGALNRPPATVAPYADHLALLVREARRAPAPRADDLRGRVRAINRALFESFGYRGDRDTYDDLDNANLLAVIDRRKGLPIAISILYLHVARALGWRAEGVNFPGHFLVRLAGEGAELVIDPFDGGAVRDGSALARLVADALGGDEALSPSHLETANNRDILLRLERNIKLRCLRDGRHAEALAAVERMAMIAPSAAIFWLDAAMLNAELGQLHRAGACLDAADALDGDGRLKRERVWARETLRTRMN